MKIVIILWHIWKQCNDFIFKHILTNIDALWFLFCRMLQELEPPDLHLPCHRQTSTNAVSQKIQWQALKHGWLKINVDAACSNLVPELALRATLSNHDGRIWDACLKRNLFILQREMNATLMGLQLAKKHTSSKFILESDSLQVVQAINGVYLIVVGISDILF